MLIFLLLSLAAGYLLNEEQALQRICYNLSYPHEGWLLWHNPQALWILAGSFLLSFVKAVAWGELVLQTGSLWAEPALLLYCCGNIAAVKQNGGLYYTPWLTMLGLGLAHDPLLFQVPFTAFCVIGLLSRRIAWGISAAIGAGALAACLLGSAGEIAFSFSGLALIWYFSGRQSPFSARLIRYR